MGHKAFFSEKALFLFFANCAAVSCVLEPFFLMATDHIYSRLFIE